MRVLIIGGGIGGLAAAVGLRQAGFTAAVYERAPEVTEVGAGLTVWTNAVRALARLGVGPAVEKVATPLRTSELRTWRGKLLAEMDLARIGEKYGFPSVGVHRADLLQALAAACGPGVVTLKSTCTAFTHDADGVTVRFADGRTDRGDLLIGADGLRSCVRTLLHGSHRPRYAGYTAWRAVARVDRPEVPVGVTVMAVGRGSQFGFLPIGNGRTYWFCTANVPEGERDVPGTVKAKLLARFAGWYAPVPAVIEATDEAAILRNDVLDRPPAPAWGTGRVTLLGDAAHPTTPNLGQGACMAIEDAVALARSLVTAPHDPVAALRAYERERIPRTAFVTNQSWRLGRWLAKESRLMCAVRDTMVKWSRSRILADTERLIGADV